MKRAAGGGGGGVGGGGARAARRRPDQRPKDGIDRRAAAAGGFGRFQLVQTLAVGGEAAGDEQLGDQLVLGAEMIIYGGEIDVRRRDDVAQRDVGKPAIGVEPLGGIEDGGTGLV